MRAHVRRRDPSAGWTLVLAFLIVLVLAYPEASLFVLLALVVAYVGVAAWLERTREARHGRRPTAITHRRIAARRRQRG